MEGRLVGGVMSRSSPRRRGGGKGSGLQGSGSAIYQPERERLLG